MGPDQSEFRPDPDSFFLVSTLFGWRITGQRQTTLIQEAGYPNGNLGETGRIALFVRDQSGRWVRSGSIDPPSGQTFSDGHMALFNELSLFQSSEGLGALLYRRTLGKWNLVQRLTPPSGYRFTEVALSNGWAFIGAVSPANAGGVHVYQTTSTGTLKGVQTLRSSSGDPKDGFGEHVAVFGERLVVSATGDNSNRGAAYVFERSGALFAKRQKLIAINGAANQRFAHSIGISEDWIAIGAPDAAGPADNGCLGGRISGAIYTFRRIGGVWLQQDALLADAARDQAHGCGTDLGENLVIAGKWIVSQVTFPSESGDDKQPLIYVRDAGHYEPVAWANTSGLSELGLNLVDSTLFVGTAVERGCNFEACIGSATIFDLNDAVP